MDCAHAVTRSPHPLFADPITRRFVDAPAGPANSHPEAWDLHRCPRAQVDHGTWLVVQAWSAHRWGGMAAGPLPASGGSMDQTLHWIEAARVLDSILAETQAKPAPRSDD